MITENFFFFPSNQNTENVEMSKSEKDLKIEIVLSDIESMSEALDALKELLEEKPGDYDIEIEEYCYKLRKLATEISKSLTNFQE